MISPGLLVMVALGALSAGFALLMARLEFRVVADVCAIGAAALGIAAFVTVASSTIQRVRHLPRRTSSR